MFTFIQHRTFLFPTILLSTSLLYQANVASRLASPQLDWNNNYLTACLSSTIKDAADLEFTAYWHIMRSLDVNTCSKRKLERSKPFLAIYNKAGLFQAGRILQRSVRNN